MNIRVYFYQGQGETTNRVEKNSNLSEGTSLDNVSDKKIVNHLEKQEVKTPEEIKFDADLQKIITKEELSTLLTNFSANKIDGITVQNMKNKYANQILDHVIAHQDLLPIYITALKGNITLFGSDKATQVANYNTKLLPKIDKTKPEYKDLLAVKFLIENQKAEQLSQSIKENLNQIIEQYGAALLTAIEWVVGGKGKLAEFCKKWKLEQYFPTIEKFYETRYSLTPEQKEALQVPYGLQNTFLGADKITDNVTCDKEKIQNYYSKDRLALNKTEGNNKDNFHLLDPILVSRAIQNNKLTQFDNLIIPGDKKNGEQQYTFNDTVKLTLAQEQTIVGYMVADKSLWTNISNLNDDLRGESVYGRANSSSAEEKVMSDENDVAMTFGVCLMKGSKDLKYVVSETKNLPNQADKENKKETDTKQSEWKDLFTSKKNYPATELIGNKLDPDHKTEKDRIVTSMNKLFDNATHAETISILNSELSLTNELKSFIDSYLSVYLNAIINDPKTKKDIIPKAQGLLDKKNAITKDFALSMDSEKMNFSGKNAAGQDVSFISTSIIELLPTSVTK